MSSQASFILLVLINHFFSSSKSQEYIARWRNKDYTTVFFYEGTQVGMGEQPHSGKIDNPEQMVDCIEKRRQREETSETSGILHIDKALEYFGMCYCGMKRSNCERATTNYSSSDLKYRHFYRFRVEKSFGGIRYFEQQNLPEKKENIFIKTITNRSSKKVSSNAEITIVKTDSQSTSMSSEIGGSLGATVDIKAGIVNVKSTLEQSYSYSGSITDKTETKSTFALNRAFDVPPNSAVQIICSLKNQPFDLKWEIPVTISGAVAVKYKNDKDVPTYLFVNVSYIAPYFKEFSLTKEAYPKLRTFIRGRTQGMKHYSAEVNPQDMPLTDTVVTNDICNPLQI